MRTQYGSRLKALLWILASGPGRMRIGFDLVLGGSPSAFGMPPSSGNTTQHPALQSSPELEMGKIFMFIKMKNLALKTTDTSNDL